MMTSPSPSTPAAPGPWLTPDDAGRILGLSGRTIRRRLDALPAHLVRHAAHRELPGLGKKGGRVVHTDALPLLRGEATEPATDNGQPEGTTDIAVSTAPEPDGSEGVGRRPRKPHAPRQPRRRDRSPALPPFELTPPVVVADLVYFEGWLQVARLSSRVGPLVSLAHLGLCASDGERRPTWSRFRRVALKACAFGDVADALQAAADGGDPQAVTCARDGDDFELTGPARRPVGLRLVRDRNGAVKAVSLCELRAGSVRLARVPSCGSVVVMDPATAARLAGALQRLTPGPSGQYRAASAE